MSRLVATLGMVIPPVELPVGAENGLINEGPSMPSEGSESSGEDS